MEYNFNQTCIEMLVIVCKYLVHNKAWQQLLCVILYHNNTTNNVNQHEELDEAIYPIMHVLHEHHIN